MISVKDLCFSYGSHEVLRNISFDAAPGEMLCILGRNGAGKSTLFKCMLGILKGYTGKVVIDGDDMSLLRPADKAKRVAYIPQATNPAFSYSVLDMVLMGTTSQIGGRMSPGRAEKEAAMQALAKIGISHLAGRGYSRLSGGEQQLVLIARALAQGAHVLIMDEPTSSLDYGNQMRVQKQLRQLISEGYTIIQSSHNPEQSYTFADRIICIRDGELYRQGRPQEILDEDLINKLYGIDVEMIRGHDDKARFFILKEEDDESEKRNEENAE